MQKNEQIPILQQFVTKCDLFFPLPFSRLFSRYWRFNAVSQGINTRMTSQHHALQTSLKQVAELRGIGLHSGRFIEVRLLPAPAGHGIVFYRTDIHGLDPIIPALIDNISDARLCTRIQNADGVSMSTIEHFMAAFHGLGLDNVLIEVDGPEMPILDGSAIQIVTLLQQAGIVALDKVKPVLVVTKPIEVKLENDVVLQLLPSETLDLDIQIDFADPAIGRQHYHYTHQHGCFENELADARTFCMLKDVETMRHSGLARGGSLDNAVVVDNGSILNQGGLRSESEFVKHKVLDCLGDLYLLGMSLRARVCANKPGHAASAALLKALMASPSSFYIENENNLPQQSANMHLPEAAVALASS